MKRLVIFLLVCVIGANITFKPGKVKPPKLKMKATFVEVQREVPNFNRNLKGVFI